MFLMFSAMVANFLVSLAAILDLLVIHIMLHIVYSVGGIYSKTQG